MKKPSQTTHVTNQLREGIRTGTFVAGSFLPGERDLAGEFGVSRGTVGTALERLASEQLIEQIHGRGTRVLPIVNRLTLPAICVVHNMPMTVGATNGPSEGMLILRGVFDQLKKLRLPHDDLGVYALQSERMSEIPNLMHFSEVHGLNKRYGAMIFLEATIVAADIEKFHQAGIPLVVANLEDTQKLPATRVDRRKTTLQAVRLLAAMGHRRIAYFGRETREYYYPVTEEGYRQALESLGIPFDESLFIRLPGQASVPVGSAAAKVKELLQLPSPPTAIITMRDYMAGAVCEAIREAGLTVGRDISVIGFDDLTWPQAEPILTTFREPCYEMGALAVEMLVDRILNPSLPVEQREVEARLVIRRSVGPPPGNEAAAAAPLLASIFEPPEAKR